ncbi:MAG TPA: 30S ribosomal protein S17 [Terriglobales bacterium]|jgi:small subunit ribosomal protein S17|nr:30S ribosomal protein S17 [Terriglobales bacterium]
MPETNQTSATASRRKTVIGKVVSTKMNKTIVVEVTRNFPHRLYRRVMSRSKKFYAHDEQNTAHVGDFVEIEETRPLSKLKRWRLKEVIRRAALVAETAEPETQAS